MPEKDPSAGESEIDDLEVVTIEDWLNERIKERNAKAETEERWFAIADEGIGKLELVGPQSAREALKAAGYPLRKGEDLEESVWVEELDVLEAIEKRRIFKTVKSPHKRETNSGECVETLRKIQRRLAEEILEKEEEEEGEGNKAEWVLMSGTHPMIWGGPARDDSARTWAWASADINDASVARVVSRQGDDVNKVILGLWSLAINHLNESDLSIDPYNSLWHTLNYPVLIRVKRDIPTP